MKDVENIPIRKKAISITVSEKLLKDAKEYDFNISQAAEDGIALKLKKESESQWLVKNRGAIESYNASIRTEGLPVKPHWLADDHFLLRPSHVEDVDE